MKFETCKIWRVFGVWCRDLLVAEYAAKYLGEFVAEGSRGGFTIGTQWLVWKYESDATLLDAMSVGFLGFETLCKSKETLRNPEKLKVLEAEKPSLGLNGWSGSMRVTPRCWTLCR